MKTIFKLLLLLIIANTSWNMAGQQTHKDHNYWQFSPRVGYDFPTYDNNTPYIDYKGGLELGFSVDYYWRWLGLGFDFDYIKNKPESNYPTSNLYDAAGTLLTDFSLSEDGITRIFYGIGPNFKYQTKNDKFHAELNTRIGLANITGGRTELRENTLLNDQLNFHAGYDQNSVLSAKGQLRFTYFFNKTFGVHLGGYYLRHFKTEELLESGISAKYRAYDEVQTGTYNLNGKTFTRDIACAHDISSIGVFAGLTIKLKSKHTNKCCTTCEKYSLAVTARDKFTKQVLANTDVALKDVTGNIVQTGTTNTYGVVIFNDIEKANYSIEGKLYEVALSTSAAAENEFVAGETLQKEILYEDDDFIIQGKAVVCNTNTGLPGVSVILQNTTEAEQKTTVTNAKGEYILHLSQSGIYTIRGRKENYFSQTETVDPSNYNRKTTLFVKLEICLEEADCGKSIALRNIHYDLDEYFIRPDAKPELNRLVLFMTDNPSIKVEVSSHTDSRASHSYNQTLSQNRANAAIDYLVSQGIDRSRLSGVGYGETKLLNECADNVNCTEAQHQLNRRTEMKVICQ